MKYILITLLLLLSTLQASQLEKENIKVVNVLLGFDKPPFIFGRASAKGIEADLLREAFNSVDYKVNISQGKKSEQETILYLDNDIDAVATISETDNKLFYSDTFTIYDNYAITRKNDNIIIDSLEDLKKINFVTWKNAYNDLGEKFNKLYNPHDGKYRDSYHDTLTQISDAKMFFSQQVDAIIVDKSIFNWHKLYFENNKEYTFHKIFNIKKEYPVAFRNKKIRDDFNIGLNSIKQNGRYDEIIKFYETQNVNQLITLTKLLSDISAKYIFKQNKEALINLLRNLVTHPDIEAVSIRKNNKKYLYLNLLQDNNNTINTISTNEELPKITNKIYYKTEFDLLYLGELSLYYKRNYKTKNANAIPILDSLKRLNNKDYDHIKKFYKKWNIENNPTISDVNLTEEEKEYLKDKKIINVCLRENLKPFMIKDNQDYSGISVDFLNNISKKLDIKMNYIYNNRTDKYPNNFKNSTCDIAALIVAKPNFFHFLTPTIPYVVDDIVIATSINKPYISDFSKLNNEKIMMQKGHKNIIQYIKKLYPNLHIVEVDNFDLNRVSSGEFYAAVDPYTRMAYLIASSSGYNIKIMGKIGKRKLEGSFGVKNSELLLLKILNKAIEKTPKEIMKNIERKYSIIKVEERIDYLLVFLSFIIILIILVLYLKQKRLAEIIRQEKEKFKNIFYKASDGISILTNNSFTDCNNSLVDILGYDNKNQVLNLSPSQLSPKYQPDSQESLKKSILMINIARRDGVNNFEWKHLKANGEEFWVDIVLTDISTKDGEEIIHGVWRDIQLKKEMEAQLLELNTNLELKVQEELEKNQTQQFMLLQQSRLAQMGEMISMIAHQWRQPLNNLSLLTQSVILKYKANKLDIKYMDDFHKNTKKQITQMSNTIDDFRNFFRPEKDKSNFSLSKPLYTAIDILKPKLDSGRVRIEKSIDEKLSINGFENEIGQTVINILNNSVDAFNDKQSDKEKVIKVSIFENNHYIIISISDNAGGIPDNILNKIFDPYFSTKNEKNGTGLGLYMSKVIIEEHMNAKLEVSNDEDGAVFTMTFKKSK